MNLEEFIRLDPSEIRRDNNLMQLFVKYYEAAFSVKPNCAGCVFKTGFKKLKSFYLKGNSEVKKIKYNKMDEKTFLLKKQHKLKILTYQKDGKTHRCYGYNLTEDFAKELVNCGKSDLFIKEPVINDVKEDKFDNVELDKSSKYYSMDYREEVLPIYSILKETTGLKAKSNKKGDIIAFIEEHES